MGPLPSLPHPGGEGQGRLPFPLTHHPVAQPHPPGGVHLRKLPRRGAAAAGCGVQHTLPEVRPHEVRLAACHSMEPQFLPSPQSPFLGARVTTSLVPSSSQSESPTHSSLKPSWLPTLLAHLETVSGVPPWEVRGALPTHHVSRAPCSYSSCHMPLAKSAGSTQRDTPAFHLSGRPF